MLLCAGLMAALPSCNKTNNVSTSNETNNVFSKKIDERGGTVGENGGLSVFIPGGAVGEEILITIREAEEDEYPAPPETAVGKVYVIEPLGLELAAKATVHLPFPQGHDRNYLFPIRPTGDGSWARITGGLEQGASTATFESFTFSFFALEAMADSNGTAGGPAGSAGGAAMPSGGGTSGVGGSTGAGATGGVAGGNGGDYCASDDQAPTGATDIEGDIMATGRFMALDGMAAKFVEAERTFLYLTFTDTPQTCGGMLAAGMGVDGGQPIPGATPGVSVALKLDIYAPDPEGEIPIATEYPRASDSVEVEVFEQNATCQIGPADPVNDGIKVTIDEIMPDRIIGSLEILESDLETTLSGTFDVPLCDLPMGPPKQQCCVEP